MQSGIYRHYKGGYYQVIGVGEHTETKEQVVVYVALTGIHMPGPRIRVRPLDGPEGWNTQALDQGGAVDRFVFVGDELSSADPRVTSPGLAAAIRNAAGNK